jgi:hypothetical protein
MQITGEIAVKKNAGTRRSAKVCSTKEDTQNLKRESLAARRFSFPRIEQGNGSTDLLGKTTHGNPRRF